MEDRPDHLKEPDTQTVEVIYFAWVREKTGRARETVAVPPHVGTVAELMAWLRCRGPGYAEAFANPAAVRAAIDRAHVKPGASIGAAREIAFFPPVTGG